MSDSKDLSPQDLSLERVKSALEVVVNGGISQRNFAYQLDVPVQYLSDYKQGRRKINERVARRFQEQYGYHWLWLLGRSDVEKVSQAETLGRTDQGPTATGPKTILPILPHPIEGDPRRHPKWDGSLAEVVGAAEAKLTVARMPYVLRFGANDRENRVHAGDLLLMSQAPPTDCAGIQQIIQVIRHGRGMYLARSGPEGWIRLAKTEPLIPSSECTVHGHALGIIWGALL